LSVNLFNPPQREAYRVKVMEMRNSMTDSAIAEILKITKTAAQRAASLQRMMDILGITDPYLPIADPPEGNAKFRRHKHARYRFEPSPHAGQF
jgi:site-specific DNA recombinase